MRYFVEVVEQETGKIIKRLGPMSENKAELVEMGILRNMNLDKFCTGIIPDSKEAQE